jgi:hypothetical protein
MGVSTTSISTKTVLPFNVTMKYYKSLRGWKPCPSNTFKVVRDGVSLGEARALQQVKYMTQVEAPSSQKI